MPDWYVRRNDEGAAYPYSVRLGGCEYSLTEEEFFELAEAVDIVATGALNYMESEGYQDICIASADKPAQRESLFSLLGIGKAVINRRGM